MAWVFGGKHFGQYTYEHWFDDEYNYSKTQGETVMRKETISLLADYNKSVNRTMNEIIKTLDQAEWEKPLGGFFLSIRGLCSHLYIADFNWLRRFRNFRTFTSLGDSFFERELAFNETLFPGKDEYLEKRSALDDRISAFAAEISDDDLAGILRYTDSRGNPHKKNFGGCVLQFLVHEIHHRGMASLYLEILGRENDFGSLAQVL